MEGLTTLSVLKEEEVDGITMLIVPLPVCCQLQIKMERLA